MQESITTGDPHILKTVLETVRGEMTTKFTSKLPKLLQQLQEVCLQWE